MATPTKAAVDRLNVLWGALAKVAEKQHDRDGLADGAAHKLEVEITGKIDGRPVSAGFHGQLTVGYPSDRAPSVTPHVDSILALALSKLTASERVAFLGRLPELFGGDELPKIDESLVGEVKAAFKRLRDRKTSTIRGTVRCDHQMNEA